MFRQAAPRLRTTVERSITAGPYTAKHWAPATHNPDVAPDNVHQDPEQDGDEDAMYMTTDATFDLGMTRSILNSSITPLFSPIQESNDVGTMFMVTYIAFDPCVVRPLAEPYPHPPRPSPPSMQAVVKPDPHVKTVINPIKPWPYKLPKFLQPRAATTYAMKYGTHKEAEMTVSERVGVLQAILYGVPEPDKAVAKQVSKQGGVLHAILYGVKKEEVVTAAKGEAVVGVTAVKVQKDDVVVIKEVEVMKKTEKKGIEKTMEVGGFQLLAK
ncbi:hypothetical protein EK21DRAFT_112017 [Setomelanomma holmii]|uniref:Uncharacterized protein n=1 Tax=Setomelanomma holmii TaxID=210430 RepID=A0A9P4H9H5_9PLEO|nr:hypothetical protein EK21DRAFT_112017 [Setomelanomma holmii]